MRQLLLRKQNGSVVHYVLITRIKPLPSFETPTCELVTQCVLSLYTLRFEVSRWWHCYCSHIPLHPSGCFGRCSVSWTNFLRDDKYIFLNKFHVPKLTHLVRENVIIIVRHSIGAEIGRFSDGLWNGCHGFDSQLWPDYLFSTERTWPPFQWVPEAASRG
jgi:hypothetical protein